MGVLGSLFPGQKIRDESSEAGNAQGKPEITSIDLENGTVTLRGLAAGASAHRTDDPPTEPVARGRGQKGGSSG